LIELSMLLTGHMRGGLAQVSVVLSALMGGVNGSSNADAAMQSRIIGPDMIKQGYSKGYTASLIAFTALITSTLPPGVGMILYGTAGQVSIGRLFAAGLFVGPLLMVFYMIAVAFTARKKGYKPYREKRASAREVLQNLKSSVWALIFPLILLVCLRLGLFTPAEVGSLACIYAVVVGLFIYRKLSRKNIMQTLVDSITDIGGIMLMISLSGIFGFGIPIERVPQRVTAFIVQLTDNPYVLMFLIVTFLVIIGMFMEGSIIILLTTPILLPLVISYGFDPVVFGLIVSVVVTMGIATPPAGIAMFIVCGNLECDLKDYVRECWPFFIVVLAVTTFMVVFPQAVLFLPNLLFG